MLFLAARLFFDVHEIANDGPIGKPGVYAVGIGFIPILFLFVPICFLFTFVACLARCPGRLGVLAALISLLVILLALPYRFSWFLFPAAFIGKTTHSSVGWYTGALIQILIAAWLLGWLDKWMGVLSRRNLTP